MNSNVKKVIASASVAAALMAVFVQPGYAGQDVEASESDKLEQAPATQKPVANPKPMGGVGPIDPPF